MAAAVISKPNTEQRVKYQRTIDDLVALSEKVSDQLKAAPTGGRAQVLEDKLGAVVAAIEVWQEALDLDLGGEVIQFGATNGRNLRLKVPPHIDEYSARHRPMIFEKHVFKTPHAIEVVTIRRIAVQEPGLGIEEMEVGLHACVAKEGEFIGFFPTKYYLQLVHKGALKF